MLKVSGLLAAAAVACTVSVSARADIAAPNAATDALVQIVTATQRSAMTDVNLSGLNWHVGDKASYKLTNMILNGTIDAFVRDDTGTSFWLEQDAKLGIVGEQKIEMLMNKTTGKIEKLLIGGKEQKAPEPNVEVVEMKEDHVTVPAGSFDCIYAKIKNKDDGKISQAWLNPKLIPMSGQLKAIAESQFGEITQELTSFSFATPSKQP